MSNVSAIKRMVSRSRSAQVQLWLAAHDRVSVEEMALYRGWFTAPEAEQFSKFLSERRRQEFIIGRGLARLALGEYFDIRPERIEFSADAHGKLFPHVPEQLRSAHFSISHTHDVVVVALCPEFPVGVDIEREVDRLEPTVLSERFYSHSEHQVLSALQGTAQRDRFYLMWTLKEALGKAHGLGVLSGTHTTHFDLVEGNILRALCWESTFREAWLAVSAPSGHHRLALCVLCDDSTSVRVRVAQNQTAWNGLPEITWFEGRLRNSPNPT